MPIMSGVSFLISACTALIWWFSALTLASGRPPGNHCIFQKAAVMLVVAPGGTCSLSCAFAVGLNPAAIKRTKIAVSNQARRADRHEYFDRKMLLIIGTLIAMII